MIDSTLKDLIKDNLCVEAALDGSHSDVKCKRGLQYFASLKFRSPEYESLISAAVQSEISCPGSGLLVLKKFVGEKDQIFKKIRNKRELIAELRERSYSPIVFDILKEIVDHAGRDSRISIKKSSGKRFIELSEGYSFNLSPLLNIPLTDIKNPKVVCIDGYIESVSEIHRLLEDISSVKLPCFIFSRGMSADVLYTLKINNDRKTLVTFPYVVPYDVDGVNIIVDLAVVSGTDVVSSTKGDLISNTDMSKCGSFEDAIVFSDVIRVKNSKSRERVGFHIEHLKKMLEERPELTEILSKRMRSLTSSCIDVCIPDGIDFYSTSQQLDEGIRIISSVMNNSYDPSSTADLFYESFKSSFEETKVFTHLSK